MREKMRHIQKWVHLRIHGFSECGRYLLGKVMDCAVQAPEVFALQWLRSGPRNLPLRFYAITAVKVSYLGYEYRCFDVECPRIGSQGRVMKKHVLGENCLSSMGRDESLNDENMLR